MKRNILVQFTCLLVLAGGLNLQAANGTWTNDASGNWSDTTQWLGGTVADASGFTADFSTINLTANRTVTLDAAHTLTTLKFGDIIPDFNWTLSGANTLTLAGTTPTINVLNQNTTISSVIAGAAGLTKAGLGSLTLGGATDTFTGGLKENAGTLTLDYNASGSPSSTLVPSQALTLAGGTLNINGNAGTATSQSFASAAFTAGGNIINMVNNGTSPTLALGGLTWSGYATVAYLTSGTSTITTTTHGAGPGNILWNDYDVYGTSDWAVSTNASSPYNIAGLSSWAGYVTTMGGTGQNQNMDLQANYTAGGNVGTTTIRFNTPTATNVNVNGKWVIPNAVLVTPNMGANNCAIGNGNWYANYNTAAATEWVVQNNTAGYFGIGSLINDKGGAGALTYVQSGPGTVVMPGTSTTSGAATLSANQFTGQTYLNGGQTVVGVDADLGAPATGAQVNLNGGTIVAGTITGSGGYPATVSGSASVTLDAGGGAHARNIILGNAGGGLAATAGSTLTVDGQVGSAAGTGPLVIGIPASSANGNVAGLLPGTGSGTANTTAVNGTGTVKFNGVGNYFYGGVTILGGATLNINSEWQLGGANQGPVIFNNGTLQYNTTLLNAVVDITQNSGGTPQPITFVGNATIDVNGQNVTYTNAIGNGGSGALTVVSTAANGILNLLTNNNYSGGTTISGGTLRINNTTGSGTGSGNVTIASGGILGGNGTISGAVTNLSGGHVAPGNGGVGTNYVGALTMSSGSLYDFEFGGTANDQTVVTTSGGLTLNGGAFNLYQPGGTVAFTTTGTYNLIQYSGAIGGTGLDSTWTTASAGNPHIANPQAGLAYAFGTSGGFLTLTISTAGVVGIWNNDADGNWTDGTKWSSNPNVPHSAGDAATFGVGSALRTVTLNANETVGGLFFTNANSFVIASAGNTLTLDNSGGGVNVSVSAGAANALKTSVALKDNTQITVIAGNSFAISGIVSNGPSVTKTLAFNGAGTNILSAANTYGPASGSTGTTLSGGGILQVANNSALGAGDLSVTANSTLQAGAPGLSVLNNIGVGVGVTATVDNNGQTLSLGGAIGGSGALTKVGNGTLALGGINSYSGNTTVNAGTLSLSSAANVANSPNIVLNGGDLLGNGSFTLPNNIRIGLATGSANTSALIDAAGTFSVNGTIASAGNVGVNSLTVNSLGGTGTLILGGANTFNGVTSLSNAVLQVANTLALQNSTLDYDAGTLLFDPSITAATFGGLSGTNAMGIGLTNLSGAALTLTVGNNNSSTTYYGGLSGGGGLSKLGTGTLTASNLTYTGNTIVYSGGLVINAPSALTSHLDISAQYGVGAANVTVNGASLTSPNGLYITSPTGSSGTIYGFGANLTSTNGAQVTANADGNGRAISYGAGNGRPGSGSLTVGTAGDSTTSVTANGALDMFYSSGGSAVANFAVNLNGGVLAVDNIQESTYGNQSATFNFNGGLLRALGNDVGAGFFPAAPAQLTAVVNAGGARIDDNGFTITVANVLKHGTGSPDGGLTKLGSGTLILNAANTYTGNTTISNGVLALGASGTIANSPKIIVGGNATFDVSAIGGLVLGSSQTLSNSSSTATLNGNLDAGSGTVSLNYASGTPAFSVTNGTLTLEAATIVEIDNTGAALAVGSYKLISTNLDGTGFVSGTAPTSVTVGGNGLAGGAVASLQISNSELYLVVAPGVNLNSPPIQVSISGNTLSLGWPTNLGWTLQTNSVDLSNTNYWFPYSGSSSVTNVNITIDPTQAKVFYRLVYP